MPSKLEVERFFTDYKMSTKTGKKDKTKLCPHCGKEFVRKLAGGKCPVCRTTLKTVGTLNIVADDEIWLDMTRSVFYSSRGMVVPQSKLAVSTDYKALASVWDFTNEQLALSEIKVDSVGYVVSQVVISIILSATGKDIWWSNMRKGWSTLSSVNSIIYANALTIYMEELQNQKDEKLAQEQLSKMEM